MAGKRIYLTIPARDAELIRHLGVETGECIAMLCRRWVLTALYKRLEVDVDLQGYDAEQARLEREELLHGRTS